MRLAELLDSTVVDVDGETVGSVEDVRLVQDGPLLEGFGAALRVEGLIVGRGRIAARLGYRDHRVSRPVLLKLLFTAMQARARYVPWQEVHRWDGTTVTLLRRGVELPRMR